MGQETESPRCCPEDHVSGCTKGTPRITASLGQIALMPYQKENLLFQLVLVQWQLQPGSNSEAGMQPLSLSRATEGHHYHGGVHSEAVTAASLAQIRGQHPISPIFPHNIDNTRQIFSSSSLKQAERPENSSPRPSCILSLFVSKECFQIYSWLFFPFAFFLT